MLRSYLFVNINSFDDYLPEMDRWFFRDHVPDTISQTGPILDRYVTYRVVPEPEGSTKYCCYNRRMTEHWWRENPFRKGQTGHTSMLSLMWCDNYKKTCGFMETKAARTSLWQAKAPAFIFIDPIPSEDFKGRTMRLLDSTILRWVTMFKYQPGVSLFSCSNAPNAIFCTITAATLLSPENDLYWASENTR